MVVPEVCPRQTNPNSLQLTQTKIAVSGQRSFSSFLLASYADNRDIVLIRIIIVSRSKDLGPKEET